MNRRSTFGILMSLLCVDASVWAQKQPPAPARAGDRAYLDLVMERFENKQWKALDPQTVLDNGDSVRFRLQASFSGYLYAYYRGSAGEAEWLYPTPGSTDNNRIEGGGTYMIPSTTASYTVAGKAGFDVVYWLISPRPLAGGERVPPREDERVPRTMVPRCRDAVPERTACLDGRAGAVSATQAPDSGPSGLKARELRLSTAGETTHIEAADGAGLFVYEFRIAHR
jgi:uncharacterized protein DUF4384